ncbi:MAG: Do family serine endopeptidase [Cytophagales bacterium]|nr:Do family serine endopeptidase [Cytophagales bacterium]MDW8383626.1 Do family serine endopeptidase [Flammeovirgaceae bacterium]
MNHRSLAFIVLLSSFLGGAVSLIGYKHFFENKNQPVLVEDRKIVLSRLDKDVEKENYIVPDGLNFVQAAEKVTPAVVHIKTQFKQTGSIGPSRRMDDMLREFFGDDFFRYYGNPNGGVRVATGSGVILSEDGYIVTNNHVIENADKIEVILNDKRSFEAKIIGTDVSTDLALLKIEAKDLPYLVFGNSDNVKIGQWVLAIGNPFDLTSTVTAGIVSAKARNIGILRQKTNLSIESFIQTDAAVNPGNSGGALVDLNGNLVGINTAIASNTGSYTGYSFAVPSALVKKVVTDLKEFGTVQRGLLGIQIRDVDAEVAKEYKLPNVEGVYVIEVGKGSGAENAGIKSGDVILGVNGIKVNNTSELQELIARQRPGDKVTITYRRDNKVLQTTAILKNQMNTTDLVKADNKDKARMLSELGAEVVELSDDDKKKYNVEAGLKIKKLYDGKLKEAGVREGFVITRFDKRPIAKIEDLQQALNFARGGVLIEGVYPGGEKAFYGIGL